MTFITPARRPIHLHAAFVLAALALAALAGCGRDPDKAKSTNTELGSVRPPAVKPEYTFAEGLREQYPGPAGFVRQFLETCLAGDYAGYRLLASRKREPESRERFTAVYHGIRALHVEAIEPKELPDISSETYLVVCRVEFPPDSKVQLRRKTNKVAILAFKEEGEWRMLPAPAGMQPKSESGSDTTSAPASTSAPSYPWDDEGP